MTFRLPTKDSATWRAVVTSVEGTIVLLLGLVALPEVQEYITQTYPAAVPVFALLLAIANYVRNLSRKDVQNY